MAQESNHLVTLNDLKQTINKLIEEISSDEKVSRSELSSETWTFILEDDTDHI